MPLEKAKAKEEAQKNRLSEKEKQDLLWEIFQKLMQRSVDVALQKYGKLITNVKLQRSSLARQEGLGYVETPSINTMQTTYDSKEFVLPIISCTYGGTEIECVVCPDGSLYVMDLTSKKGPNGENYVDGKLKHTALHDAQNQDEPFVPKLDRDIVLTNHSDELKAQGLYAIAASERIGSLELKMSFFNVIQGEGSLKKIVTKLLSD